MENKFGDVKKNIISIMADGKKHTKDEIYEKVNKLVEREISKSNIETSLSQLHNQKGIIDKTGVGEYKLSSEEYTNMCKKNNMEKPEEITIESAIKFCESWQKQLGNALSYSMAQKQFIKNSKINELNKKYILELKKIIEIDN